MATTFDEVLLDERYSAIADGGPEFATAIIRSGSGGSIASRAETREDYQSKYEVSYAELDFERQQDLRSFAILRKGMARGFRFLAPDDHLLDEEICGVVNEDGELVRMPEYSEPPPPPPEVPIPSDITDVYLIKYYADTENQYVRRIVKPSPYEDVVIRLRDGGIYTATINAGTAVNGDGSIDETVTGTIDTSASGTLHFTFNFYEGSIHFDDPLPEHADIAVSCTYHLPVAFTDDWHRFKVDEVTISEFKVGLEEILPIELGITP